MKRQKKRVGRPQRFKKMSIKEQAKYIQLMGELLLNGFSIQEAITILLKIQAITQIHLQNAQRLLQEGHPFYDVLQQMGFSSEKLVQVELAETHGNLIETLKGIAEQFRLVEEFRKELKKMISYPCLLLIFLLGILVALRQMVLPQLLATDMVAASHWGIVFLKTFHWYLLGAFLVGGLLLIFIQVRLTKMDVIQKYTWFSQLVFFGRMFSLYQSSYIALELGKLFYEGLELRQIIYCLKETRQGSLIQLLAFRLTKGLESGIPLAEQFQSYTLFTEDFSQIILQGEAKGQLGKELLFYSSLTIRHFFQKINRILHWIQRLFLNRELASFTLIEMLIVLLVISALVLLFIPNISRYRDHVNKEGRAAVLQLIDAQKELYSLQNNGKVPTIAELLKEGYIKQEHADAYNKK